MRRKRKLVTASIPESLYNKIELFRKGFIEKNKINITTIDATDIFGKKIKIPKIPDINKK